MNQRGFATLEVILMVMVIGILASIAIPRFGDVTTRANTAKIQADLSTIDTAISIYIMEKGTDPSTVADLSDYLNDADKIKPPTGKKAYIKGTPTEIKAKSYDVKKTTTSGENTTTEIRATLDNYTLAEFTTTKP